MSALAVHVYSVSNLTLLTEIKQYSFGINLLALIPNGLNDILSRKWELYSLAVKCYYQAQSYHQL